MKMLICTDGSSQAENAIHFGGLIAGAARAETTLLGITEDPLDKEKIFDSLKRGQESLKTLNVDAEIVSKAGEPIEEIVKRTQRAEYDLVVIGAVRKGIRGPFAMSAKAYRIIRAVKPPVLVVMGRREALKRILICTGASRYINKAIRFTCEIAKATGASITLFHVVAEPPAVYADLIRMEENVDLLLNSDSSLARNLRREKDALDRRGVTNELRVRHGSVTTEIFEEIRRGQYDLVVAGSSRARGALRQYILGNIGREIVNWAECPVLIVRTGGAGSLMGSLKTLFKSSRKTAPSATE